MTSKRAKQRANTPTEQTPQGAPSGLTPIVQEVVSRHLAIGGYVEDAAALAGVDARTVFEWIAQGKAELERREGYEKRWSEASLVARRGPGKKTRAPRKERRDAEKLNDILLAQNEKYVSFARACWTQAANATAGMLASVSKAATGGSVVSVTTTEHTREDGTIERTTVERRAEPDWRAAAWRLERRHPQQFGRTQRVDVTGIIGVGAPSDPKVESAREWVLGQIQQLAKAAADTPDT